MQTSRPWRHIAALLAVALVASVTTLLAGGTPRSAEAMVQPFVGVTPQRLLETRSGVGNVTVDGLQQGGGVFTAGETRELPILGRGTIPGAGVDSIAINVTAISPDANGFITIFPTGAAQPTASNLNTAPGRTLPNMVIVPLGTDGEISIFNSAGTTHLAIDILGWFPTGGAFVGSVPQRLLDSRTNGITVDGLQQAGGAFAAGETRQIPIVGRGTVPSTAVGSVAINVTAISPTGTGFITVFATGAPQPTASNLNTAAGRTLPNMVIVPLGTDGKISIFNSGSATHIAVDVLGWFPAGTSFNGLNPQRMLDTRGSGVTVDGQQQNTGVFTANQTRELPIAGRGAVPAVGVGAVAINVTAISPTATGFITVFPTGATQPTASNLNTAAGRTVPNMVIVPLGTDGKISIFNAGGSTHLAVDVLGWFPAATASGTSVVSKALNTRSHGGSSTEAIISRDGNKVAFTSLASNLVVGDTNRVLDVFIADLTTNVVERVSVSDSEAQLNAASTSPAISDDGRFVAFVTAAPIVAADTNGANDVYRRDLQTGTTTLVSIRTNNTQFVSATGPAISGDGNVIAFDADQPDAFNLPENQTIEHHVFVRDVAAGTAVQASLNAGNFDVGGGGATISQDGDKIAFAKHYSHSGGGNHVFRYDRSANTLTQFTPQITGNDGAIQGGNQPVISDDGTAVVYRRGNHVYFFQAFGSEQAIDVSTGNAVGNAAATRARFAGSSFDVIFESDATNLVAGDTNGQRDIFLRTTGTTKTTSLMSTKVKAGFVTQSNGFSTSASMSGNGRLVTISNATNLAPLTDNGSLNVMLRTGTSTTAHRLVDISGFTAVAHGSSDRSNMSPDGRYVVFDSSSDDVTNGHPNVGTDSYLLDRVTQQISFVGVRANGLTFAAGTNSPDVSDNGNTVAFHAVGNGDVFSIQQVWAHDRTTGLTELVSGTTSNVFSSLPASEARISGNGRFVVFTSGASNLIAGDTNARIDVFVRDLQTNTTERVNLTSTGGEPTGALSQFTTASPTISADGRFVAFDSSATNLVPGATTAQRRVYVRDRLLGTTTLVGRGSAGEISDDGKVVVFNSFDALTVDDTNGVSDLFAVELATSAITRVSVATGNVQAAQGGFAPSISADGRFVSFESASTDLVAGDTNGTGDVFLHDRQTGITTRVSVGAAGAEANGQSFAAAVSTDGRFVSFTSFADNLAPGDVNGTTDVFIHDTGVIAP